MSQEEGYRRGAHQTAARILQQIQAVPECRANVEGYLFELIDILSTFRRAEADQDHRQLLDDAHDRLPDVFHPVSEREKRADMKARIAKAFRDACK